MMSKCLTTSVIPAYTDIGMNVINGRADRKFMIETVLPVRPAHR